MKTQQFVAELADREAIRDVLMRYCRGVDRCDEALLRSAYWPDGSDDHAMPGRPPINSMRFIDKILPKLRAMDQSSHSISNVFIRIDGNRAAVESYFRGHHRIREENGAPRDIVTAGRYLDHMEQRDGEWRILHRVVAVDWFREYADSADWEAGTFGGPCVMGTRHPDDLSYRFFGTGG